MEEKQMKKTIALVLALCLLLALGACAYADWPKDGDINVLIPANTGGDTDTTFRTFSTDIGEQLGTNVMLTNMAGGAGALATYELLDYESDGYTGLWHHYDTVILTMLGKVEQRYDEYLDIVAAIPVEGGNYFLTVRKDSEWETLDDFINYAKENPGKIIWAIEAGGWSQMFAMYTAKTLGIEVNCVDCGSASNRNAALLGGNCDVLLIGPSTVVDTYPDDFKALASASLERQAADESIPTFKELGFDIVSEKFYLFAFKAGTDQAIIDAMADAIEHAVGTEEGIEVLGTKYAYTGWEVLKGEAALDYIHAFEAKYEPIAKEMLG